MTQKSDIDRFILEALKAEGLKEFDLSGEPGLPDMITQIFRGRMWWVGTYMMANMLACTILAIICGVQFFRTDVIPHMLRWGAGFLFCANVAMGSKLWYWMQVERNSMIREIKRVELMIAHIASKNEAGGDQ
jgi:hypothetical protein